jgi:hypothetical protein
MNRVCFCRTHAMICENKHKLNNKEVHVARKAPPYIL